MPAIMSLVIKPEFPPLRVLENGSVRIAGTRIGLEHVVANYRNGWSPERIVEEYSTLNLADVHAVIAWYLRHRDEVDHYMTEQDQTAERVREEVERVGMGGATLKEKLKRRREGSAE